MLPPRDKPLKLIRGRSSDLPSRAADFLYWLGRYSERCENLARILSCMLKRITREEEWDCLLRLHEFLDSNHSRLTSEDEQGNLDVAADFEHEILSLIFEEDRDDSLYSTLSRATRSAAQVRDRLSGDMIRIVSQLNGLARVDSTSAWGYLSPGDALTTLNRTIATLSSMRGTELENITRGPGWHFLSLGHRIERSLQLVRLFRHIIVPITPQTWPMLEMLLEIGDSSMTYRSRYYTTIEPAAVLDLLMNDELNPRSLAFQLNDLSEHCKALSSGALSSEWPFARQHRLERAAQRLFDADVHQPIDHLLEGLEVLLPAFSDDITNKFFSHALLERAT
jgi:uncharacterized alpha-E superfamily protein